jgi:hypothetical protein
MDRETRVLLNELQGAINQALHTSNRFVEILDVLERSGHEVVITVDATVDIVDNQASLYVKHVGKGATAEMNWTTDDREFLRFMKIDAESER